MFLRLFFLRKTTHKNLRMVLTGTEQIFTQVTIQWTIQSEWTDTSFRDHQVSLIISQSLKYASDVLHRQFFGTEFKL